MRNLSFNILSNLINYFIQYVILCEFCLLQTVPWKKVIIFLIILYRVLTNKGAEATPSQEKSAKAVKGQSVKATSA